MSDWSWPQIIIASLLSLEAIMGIAFHKHEREPVNGALWVVQAAMWALVLGWGGFWK